MSDRVSNFPPKKASSKLDRFKKPEKPYNPISPIVARAAADLIDNPHLDAILKEVEADAIQQFTSSAQGNTGENSRTAAHYQLTAVEKIREKLQSLADTLKTVPDEENPENNPA